MGATRRKKRPTHTWRQKIWYQCKNFKVVFFNRYAVNEEKSVIYSNVEGKLVHWSKATVDHVIPLCQLVDNFLRLKGLDRTAKPGSTLSKEWQRFHKQNAKLRIVSAEYNHKTGVEIWKEREIYRAKNSSENNVQST